MRFMAQALKNSQILISAQKGSVANIIANSNKNLVTCVRFFPSLHVLSAEITQT